MQENYLPLSKGEENVFISRQSARFMYPSVVVKLQIISFASRYVICFTSDHLRATLSHDDREASPTRLRCCCCRGRPSNTRSNLDILYYIFMQIVILFPNQVFNFRFTRSGATTVWCRIVSGLLHVSRWLFYELGTRLGIALETFRKKQREILTRMGLPFINIVL